MAAYKTKCGNARIKVNNVDHNPPHCHVFTDGGNILVDLLTFAIIRPPNAELSPGIRKCLREHQLAMLQAWENVVVDEEDA